MNVRPRRPYERKTVSKAGALIFGVGIGALLATLALLIGLMMPQFSSRLENLPYYARTYYRKLFPPPQYLPTPAPTAAVPTTMAQAKPTPLQPELLPSRQPEAPVIPAAANLNTESTPEATAEVTAPAETE